MTTIYPEHEKLKAVMETSQAIGDFIETLPEMGFQLCERIDQRECAWRSLRSRGGVPQLVCRDGVVVDLDTDEQLHDCEECDGTGFVDMDEPIYLPRMTTTTKILARYFDIDLDVIEAEKRAMLESLRKDAK